MGCLDCLSSARSLEIDRLGALDRSFNRANRDQDRAEKEAREQEDEDQALRRTPQARRAELLVDLPFG